MTTAESTLHSVIDIALTLVIIAIAALIAVFVFRALPTVVPVAFRFATLLGVAVGNLLAVAFSFLIQLIPILIRVAAIAVTVAMTLHGATDAFTAYGSDLPALLPACLLVVVTIGAGIVNQSFGALVAAGAIVFVIGSVALAGSIEVRSLIIVGALSTAVAYTQFTRQEVG